jgi:L-ascorbate metabolism protein UlaG (beta-lactamase superfamily)
MSAIKADVALLPVGGTYTMDAADAAKAADIIKPKVAIPMHYGSIVGSEDDAEAFKAKCKVQVVILKAEAVPGDESESKSEAKPARKAEPKPEDKPAK